MVIGTKELLKLVKEKKLVVGLCERELTNPEGAGFDLRVGRIMRLKGGAFLGENERSTPETEDLVCYNSDITKQKTFVLRPGSYVLAETIEDFNLPLDVFGLMRPRSTMLRSGVILSAGYVNPGHKGKLAFAMYNATKHNFEIEMGARYAHVIFFDVRGGTVSGYRGQYARGRQTSQGAKEVQV